MKPALQLRLANQLAMTPQLQKAIRLLQLSAQELHAEMQLALETNPMLEINEEGLSHEETAGTFNELLSREEEQIESPYTSWEKPGRYQPKEEEDALDETIPRALYTEHSSLQEHLLWQMNLIPFTEEERWIASYIIDSINEDGIIDCTFAELIEAIQSTLDVSTQLIEKTLKRIQQFDPIGVAARNVQECLLLQLEQLPTETPLLNFARILIERHLSLLAKRNFTLLKKRLGVNAEVLAEIVALIQTLNPRPGTQIGQRTTHYTLPDLYASVNDKEWQVALNPLSLLHLRVNPRYTHQLPRQNARDARYIKQQLQEAQWFLNSIEHRNQTLLKVGQYLVEYQAPFLTLGDEALKPLDLTHVADRLDMHESTISRITMQKTIATPRGLLELKSFFSNPMNMDQGGQCSSGAIRGLLRKVIATENPVKPLSDEQLSQVLKSQGITIARRTIAKYRETLQIPAAHERKQIV